MVRGTVMRCNSPLEQVLQGLSVMSSCLSCVFIESGQSPLTYDVYVRISLLVSKC
jgi:hypothetical protein